MNVNYVIIIRAKKEIIVDMCLRKNIKIMKYLLTAHKKLQVKISLVSVVKNINIIRVYIIIKRNVNLKLLMLIARQIVVK